MITTTAREAKSVLFRLCSALKLTCAFPAEGFKSKSDVFRGKQRKSPKMSFVILSLKNP